MSEITTQKHYSTTHMLHSALRGKLHRNPANAETNDAISGIQVTSLLTPPALLGVTLWRHSSLRPLLHPKALLRHLSFASLGVGIPLGLAYGVVTAPKGPIAAATAGIKEKTIGLSQTELNFRDYSVIGGVIGALLTTTVFLRSVLCSPALFRAHSFDFTQASADCLECRRRIDDWDRCRDDLRWLQVAVRD